jgi:hypothetical protein
MHKGLQQAVNHVVPETKHVGERRRSAGQCVKRDEEMRQKRHNETFGLRHVRADHAGGRRDESIVGCDEVIQFILFACSFSDSQDFSEGACCSRFAIGKVGSDGWNTGRCVADAGHAGKRSRIRFDEQQRRDIMQVVK